MTHKSACYVQVFVWKIQKNSCENQKGFYPPTPAPVLVRTRGFITADTKEVTPAKSTFQTFFFGLSSANPNFSIVIRQIILKFQRGFKTTWSSYWQLGNVSLLWLSKHILNSSPLWVQNSLQAHSLDVNSSLPLKTVVRNASNSDCFKSHFQ